MTRLRWVVAALVVGAAVVALLLVPRLVRTTAAGPPVTARGCPDPVLTTSDDRTWSDRGFVVDQDMWNNHGGTQTLRACSYHSWSVTATQPDTPDVNAYPNVHRDFAEPPLASFKTISSRFATRTPGSGTYDVAYDLWLDGVASPTSTEVMVWTSTQGTFPSVPRRGTVVSDGMRYRAFQGGHFVAFVGPDRDSGSVDLLALLQDAVRRGWVRRAATVGQIDFGVEIRSTQGRPLEFAVTGFSLVAR